MGAKDYGLGDTQRISYYISIFVLGQVQPEGKLLIISERELRKITFNYLQEHLHRKQKTQFKDVISCWLSPFF